MRIALISDIHGNLPALEAVLAQLGEEEIDRYICLGDVAVGPWPSETVKRLSRLGCTSIVGNWDAWILDGGLFLLALYMLALVATVAYDIRFIQTLRDREDHVVHRRLLDRRDQDRGRL